MLHGKVTAVRQIVSSAGWRSIQLEIVIPGSTIHRDINVRVDTDFDPSADMTAKVKELREIFGLESSIGCCIDGCPDCC